MDISKANFWKKIICEETIPNRKEEDMKSCLKKKMISEDIISNIFKNIDTLSQYLIENQLHEKILSYLNTSRINWESIAGLFWESDFKNRIDTGVVVVAPKFAPNVIDYFSSKLSQQQSDFKMWRKIVDRN